MSQPYSVDAADIAANAEIIKNLWREGFEQQDPATAQNKLDRMYLNNPAGPGLCYVLRDTKSNMAVGVQCLVQRNFYWAGKRLSAGIMADYVVSPKHRSLGPALQLLKGCMAKSQAHIDFLYGLPNKKAEIIVKRAGMVAVGPITRYAKLLRSENFLRARLPHWLVPVAARGVDIGTAFYDWIKRSFSAETLNCKEAQGFDSFFDTLWTQSDKDKWLLAERNSQILTWRYGGKPHWQIFVANEKHSGDPIGYCVWMEKNGSAIVSDFYCRNPERQISSLLLHFSALLRRKHIASISLELMGAPVLTQQLLNAGFVAREHNNVYGLAGESPHLSVGEALYMTGFDRDTD